MSYPLDEAVQDLLNDDQAVKALATTDRSGQLYVTVDASIHLDGKGRILYLERFESSKTHTCLVSSLWFNRLAALCISRGDLRYHLQVRPVQSVICGPLFESYYRRALAERPGSDLSTVWILEPVSVEDHSYARLKEEEALRHPLFGHLDVWAT
ncbi:pyridoxamine 5'-phosphate oxidase family protein [Gorillibacterium sp. sgz5001074]|uniref:pyridoxamine 5'-phosphate oxidase family protein n=1 Tax=Gorillibacterium sp. sgz5001074 TaxID=3446695 RepID=UPI003F67877C